MRACLSPLWAAQNPDNVGIGLYPGTLQPQRGVIRQPRAQRSAALGAAALIRPSPKGAGFGNLGVESFVIMRQYTAIACIARIPKHIAVQSDFFRENGVYLRFI